MPETVPHPTLAQPGRSCFGRRRRKLKCSREQKRCKNCVKDKSICIYPAPQAGIKRKGGPYKKYKALRPNIEEGPSDYSNTRTTDTSTNSVHRALNNGRKSYPALRQLRNVQDSTNGQSDDMVQDALLATTKSSLSDTSAHTEFERQSKNTDPSLHAARMVLQHAHSPLQSFYEYWHIFVTRVDPMTKFIHCPTLVRLICGLFAIWSLAGAVTALIAIAMTIPLSVVSTRSSIYEESR